MLYDHTTMQRLRRKFYGNRKLKEKPISIGEVIEVTKLGREYQ